MSNIFNDIDGNLNINETNNGIIVSSRSQIILYPQRSISVETGIKINKNLLEKNNLLMLSPSEDLISDNILVKNLMFCYEGPIILYLFNTNKESNCAINATFATDKIIYPPKTELGVLYLMSLNKINQNG